VPGQLQLFLVVRAAVIFKSLGIMAAVHRDPHGNSQRRRALGLDVSNINQAPFPPDSLTKAGRSNIGPPRPHLCEIFWNSLPPIINIQAWLMGLPFRQFLVTSWDLRHGGHWADEDAEGGCWETLPSLLSLIPGFYLQSSLDWALPLPLSPSLLAPPACFSTS